MPKNPTDTRSQSERFIETARALECDEHQAAFDEKLKRIAQAKVTSKRITKPKPQQKNRRHR
jgi:hypothetical protein